MAATVLTPADVQFLEAAKSEGALIRITPESVAKVHTMIYVMCNSGPELQDRLMFAWQNLAKVIFPVMTFGGVMRCSSSTEFFDHGVVQGIRKVVDKLGLKHEDIGCEFHYPCKDACEVRGFGLRETILHGIEGHGFVQNEFGTFRNVRLLGHFSYNGDTERRGMATYLVNPDKMLPLVV